MHYFEDKFAAVGRAIDRVFERARDRSPRRYRVRSGPSLRERWTEARSRAVDRWRSKRLVRWDEWEPDQRRRFLALSATLGVAAVIGVGFWLYRTRADTPSLQELMDQATVRARMEMGESERANPFMGWSGGKR